jgi:hypothetical protein
MKVEKRHMRVVNSKSWFYSGHPLLSLCLSSHKTKPTDEIPILMAQEEKADSRERRRREKGGDGRN